MNDMIDVLSVGMHRPARIRRRNPGRRDRFRRRSARALRKLATRVGFRTLWWVR